jgi:hydroxymethylpyrimidine/phosphomethylpyrimidine kinase
MATVSPASAITDQWWHQAATVREQIASSEFVDQLGAGSLPSEAFIWYLAQDALYLDAYSGFLAAAARLAPSRDEREFWENSSTSAVDTELALHTAWVPAEVRTQTGPSATTQAYLDHLQAAAATGEYALITAAVLPCFWIYAEVGEALAKRNHAAHPYAEWLTTYSDEAFAQATVQAVSIADAAAASASKAVQEGAGTAFHTSCAHELAFFNAPLRS